MRQPSQLIIITLAFILVSFSSLFAVSIDISEAEITITGVSTFTMTNVYANSKYYWIDFEWDKRLNYFEPTDFGLETDFRFSGNMAFETDDEGQDVGINIWNAIPTIFSSEEFRFYNVRALGGTFWGAWKWNEFTDTFDTYYYGEEGTVTDIDGNVYRTIKIGNQWWMAENLKVTHYRNGAPIPNVKDNSEWSNLKTGACCTYGNNVSYLPTYGLLYNWYALGDNRKIAPEGWHVSSEEEWDDVVLYLGGSNIAGGKMKEPGTSHWQSPNTGATDESGFAALPGGYRNIKGEFFGLGLNAFFWTSTDYSGGNARYREMYYEHSEVNRYSYFSDKRYGFSVRCVRDN